MARRNQKNSKPHLLSEATVKKFMKLSGLEPLSKDFRQGMGYKDSGPEKYWEQPGLSKYRSGLLREQDEEEMGAPMPGEEEEVEAAPEDAAEAGDVEAKVEEIVTAIADAIEQTVPEVSVDVEGGGAPADDAAPVDAAPVDDVPAEEPPMDDAEAALRETIARAIREAMVQKEELEGGVSEEPSTLIGSGEQSELKEEEEAGGGDPPEVEAVVDAIVDAISDVTDMEVEAEPASDAPEEAPEEEGADDEAALKYEARALQAMNEALKDRKTARRLVERVLARAKKESVSKKRTSKRAASRRTRRTRR